MVAILAPKLNLSSSCLVILVIVSLVSFLSKNNQFGKESGELGLKNLVGPRRYFLCEREARWILNQIDNG